MWVLLIFSSIFTRNGTHKNKICFRWWQLWIHIFLVAVLLSCILKVLQGNVAIFYIYRTYMDSSEAVHHVGIVGNFSNCLVQADLSCCSVWRRTPHTFHSSVQANMGWLFHTQMTDSVRSITLRVMHSSQETVLQAAEPIKDTNRKREPTWFIFHGITWWAGSNAGERGSGGLPTTICTVYIMCVSGSDVQCVSSGLHVFLCKGEKRQLADSDADQRNRAGGMKSDRNF